MADISGLTRQHLPAPTTDDIDKYLHIDANGNPEWFYETPGGIVTEAGATAANDIGAATGATTALKLAALTQNATTTQEGVSEFATAAEIVTGTDDTRSVDVKQLKDSLALNSMWLTKRTKMPDGATATYSQDAFATADGYGVATAGTISVASTPGALRFTCADSTPMVGVRKNLSTNLGSKVVIFRYRTSSLATAPLKLWGYSNSTLIASFAPSTSWAIGIATVPASSDGGYNYNGFGFGTGTAGDWFEIDWVWIGDYSYLTGTLSEEAARIADQLGDSPGVGVAASGTITSNGTNVSNGDTVTVGGKVYTFRDAAYWASPGPAEGDVLIGADANASMGNLRNAINRRQFTTNDGVIYKIAAPNPIVYGLYGTTHIISLYSGYASGSENTTVNNVPGELGNQITLAKSTSATTLTLANANGTTGNPINLSGGISDAGAKASYLVSRASQGLTAKTSVVAADYLMTLDSADGFIEKKILASNFFAADGGTDAYKAVQGNDSRLISVPTAHVPVVSGGTSAGSFSYSGQHGVYTVHGKRVKYDFRIVVTATPSAPSGSVNISLPVAAVSGNYRYSGSISEISGITLESGYTMLTPRVSGSGTTLLLMQNGSTKSYKELDSAGLAAGFYITGSIEYLKA